MTKGFNRMIVPRKHKQKHKQKVSKEVEYLELMLKHGKISIEEIIERLNRTKIKNDPIDGWTGSYPFHLNRETSND